MRAPAQSFNNWDTFYFNVPYINILNLQTSASISCLARGLRWRDSEMRLFLQERVYLLWYNTTL